MIPFIRSLDELMLITQSRSRPKNCSEDSKYKKSFNINEVKADRKEPEHEDVICLPKIPKNTRQKWIKSKEALSRFFDELDYNNQIQSSYDLTLQEIQKSYDHQDVA